MLIPDGTYFIGENVTMLNRCRFDGTLVQGPQHRFVLRQNFDYPSYLDAFGDEALALQKGCRR